VTHSGAPASGAPASLLPAYGWDERWRDAFAQSDAPGSAPARVIRADRGGAEVVAANGAAHAFLAPSVALPTGGLCTGDWVAIQEGAVVAVLPRRTALLRAAAGGQSAAQALAANADCVVLTVAADRPLSLSRVERMVAIAWESGAQPVVALTKADACADVDGVLVQLQDSAPGVPVAAVSAMTGAGVAELIAQTQGTLVLLGPSGAGKSTLGNALAGAEVFAAGAVRGIDGKGRHTTVTRDLIALPRHRRVLIDTPGLRSAGVWEVDDGLSKTFADIEELAQDCRFADCAHLREPGCAVQAAVAAGALSARRLENYRKLERESQWLAARTDARLRAERQNRAKQIHKWQRENYRHSGKRR
jgi:ribosome biogenesis GTPase